MSHCIYRGLFINHLLTHLLTYLFDSCTCGTKYYREYTVTHSHSISNSFVRLTTPYYLCKIFSPIYPTSWDCPVLLFRPDPPSLWLYLTYTLLLTDGKPENHQGLPHRPKPGYLLTSFYTGRSPTRSPDTRSETKTHYTMSSTFYHLSNFVDRKNLRGPMWPKSYLRVY